MLGRSNMKEQNNRKAYSQMTDDNSFVFIF